MKPFNTINVIPFIDIMLVLLAIVLTTATFIAQGKLEIQLPKTQSPQAEIEDKRVELAIAQDGQIYLREQPIELEQLDAELEGLARTSPIVLRVDARVRFGRFVSVVDILKIHRLEKLSILTEEGR
jgi:biopolymer transport protein ExbD